MKLRDLVVRYCQWSTALYLAARAGEIDALDYADKLEQLNAAMRRWVPPEILDMLV